MENAKRMASANHPQPNRECCEVFMSFVVISIRTSLIPKINRQLLCSYPTFVDASRRRYSRDLWRMYIVFIFAKLLKLSSKEK